MEQGGSGNSWCGDRFALPGLPLVSFFVLCVISSSVPLALAEREPPSLQESSAVELFQSGYGIKRGALVPDVLVRSSKTVAAAERTAGTSRSTDAWTALISTHFVEEATKSASVGPICLAVGLALPVLAQLLVSYLGRLPPSRTEKEQQSLSPPTSVLLFSGIVRTGVLANYTIILPFAASLSTSSGRGGDDSGYLIAGTSIGAIVGLLPFWCLSVRKLRFAYICHGIIVFLGNSCWAFAGQMRSFTLLAMARLFVGLEGGVDYNTSLSIAHHARGDALTTCFFIIQFCNDMGILLGPVLAAFSTWVVKASGSSSTQLQEAAGNVLMALYGIILVAALLLNGPLPDPPDEEEDSSGNSGSEQIDAPPAEASPPDVEGDSEGRNNALGLLVSICENTYLRILQRVLFESGMIYILQVRYQWSGEASGLVMLPTVAYCAILEALLVLVLKGTFSDKTLVFAFEIKQVLGCALMLYGTQADPAHGIPFCLILGGMVTYGGNVVCGAANSALVVKRYVPNSIASRDALMLGGQVGVFAGCFFGALGSRVVLGASPSPYSLVLLMLGTCYLQFVATFLTLDLPETEEDRTHVVLALGVTGVVCACALLPAFGGLGFGNLFAWHAVFMTLAWVGVAPLGRWALKTKHLPETWQREGRRTVHDICMAIAAVFSVAGLAAAYAGGFQDGSWLLGGSGFGLSEGLTAGRGRARVIHAALGFIVVCAVALQLGTSAVRQCFGSSGNHGSEWRAAGAGKRWICTLALVTAVTGVWVSSPELASQNGWNPLLKGSLTAGLVFVACIVAFEKSTPPGEADAERKVLT